MPYLNESDMLFALLLPMNALKSFVEAFIWPQSLQLHHLENSHSALTRGARPHFKNNILLSMDREAENHRKMRRRLTAARAHQAPNAVNRL
jgi:hypothetical protein